MAAKPKKKPTRKQGTSLDQLRRQVNTGAANDAARQRERNDRAAAQKRAAAARGGTDSADRPRSSPPAKQGTRRGVKAAAPQHAKPIKPKSIGPIKPRRTAKPDRRSPTMKQSVDHVIAREKLKGKTITRKTAKAAVVRRAGKMAGGAKAKWNYKAAVKGK